MACCGELKKPSTWVAPSAEIRELKPIIKPREAILSDLLREQNREENTLTSYTSKVVIKSITKSLEALNKQLQDIEAEISKYINNHPELKKIWNY